MLLHRSPPDKGNLPRDPPAGYKVRPGSGWLCDGSSLAEPASPGETPITQRGNSRREKTVPTHKIVSHEDWTEARKALLANAHPRDHARGHRRLRRKGRMRPDRRPGRPAARHRDRRAARASNWSMQQMPALTRPLPNNRMFTSCLKGQKSMYVSILGAMRIIKSAYLLTVSRSSSNRFRFT